MPRLLVFEGAEACEPLKHIDGLLGHGWSCVLL
jgi:hypothetical protein